MLARVYGHTPTAMDTQVWTHISCIHHLVIIIAAAVVAVAFASCWFTLDSIALMFSVGQAHINIACVNQ